MTDELSPEREERLIIEMLRERGAIDPGRLGPVIDLAALGLVNSAWRNTCVEGWHAEGRLHDGDMMRVSSHMTCRYLERNQMRRGRDRNSQAGQHLEMVGARYDFVLDP